MSLVCVSVCVCDYAEIERSSAIYLFEIASEDVEQSGRNPRP